MLHPLAISCLVLVASLGLATALLASAPRHPPEAADAHRIWSLGLFFAPLGWALLELGALMPSNTLSVVAKTALAAGFAAYLVSTIRLAGVRARVAWIALPVLVVLVASAWVRWQTPNLPMRTGLVSLVCAAFSAGVAVMALRAARGGVPQAWTLASAFFASTLALGLRAATLYGPSWFGDAVAAGTLASAALGAAIVAPAIATLAFLLATSSAARDPQTDG